MNDVAAAELVLLGVHEICKYLVLSLLILCRVLYSHEDVMFICLEKDAKQCCDVIASFF